MDIEAFIPDLAGLLGVDPATALSILVLIATTANLIGRGIPDDQTGWLGTIRKIAKVIGLYAPNKIESGVTVNDVAKQVIRHEVESTIDYTVNEAAPIVKAFPGLDNVDAIIRETEGRVLNSGKE